MKNAKLILMVIAVLIAAVLAWTIVGVVVSIVKFLLLLALILFAVIVISKLSKKRDSPAAPAELGENKADRELNEAIRQLEEIKRKHLVK